MRTATSWISPPWNETRSLTGGREHSDALGIWVVPRSVPDLGRGCPCNPRPTTPVLGAVKLSERSVRPGPAAPPEVVAWLLLYLLWLEGRRERAGS